LIIPPDGTSSTNNIRTFYDGNVSVATDQAGKQKKTITDGFGRLIEVQEPGGAQ
jgi:hypothetical protein